MQIVKQISVVIDNAPGTLARICEALRTAEIHVTGLAAWGESDHGIVRLITDQPLKALDLLEEAGMIAVVRDVLCVERSNEPGALFDVARRLHESGINVDYAYGSVAGARGWMFLGVSDPAAARKALRGF